MEVEMTLLTKFISNRGVRFSILLLIWFFGTINFQRFAEQSSPGTATIRQVQWFGWFYDIFGIYPNIGIWILYIVVISIILQSGHATYLWYFGKYFYKILVITVFEKIQLKPADRRSFWYRVGAFVGIGILFYLPLFTDLPPIYLAYQVDTLSQFQGFFPNFQWVTNAAPGNLTNAFGGLMMFGCFLWAVAPEVVGITDSLLKFIAGDEDLLATYMPDKPAEEVVG